MAPLSDLYTGLAFARDFARIGFEFFKICVDVFVTSITAICGS